MYGVEVLAKAAVDVALGRTIVLLVTRAEDIVSLRISSFEVVEKKKPRVFPDLTFSGGRSGSTEERGGKGARSDSGDRG